MLPSGICQKGKHLVMTDWCLEPHINNQYNDPHNVKNFKIRKEKNGHAVCIVGHGETEDHTKNYQEIDYWVVKNSWGPQRHQNGYLNIATNAVRWNQVYSAVRGIVYAQELDCLRCKGYYTKPQKQTNSHNYSSNRTRLNQHNYNSYSRIQSRKQNDSERCCIL